MSFHRPMMQREWLVFSAALLGVLLLSGHVGAADCGARTRLSSCFDADALWITAAPSRFVSIPRSEALPPHDFSLGLGVSYLSQPVVLTALSPDPDGRKVLVVDDVLDASIAAAYSAAPHLELGLVLPFALYRTGTGLTGVTSQSGPALTGAARRDVRIGAGHDLVLTPATGNRLRVSAMSRLDLALPTGDDESFAGDRGPVLSPSVTIGAKASRVFVGAQEGARLRRPVDFGGARMGTELLTSLGVSVDVTPDGLFSVAAEAWMLPNFLSTSRRFADGGAVTSGAVVPAEWLATMWIRLRPVTIGLGGGTAIPLSGETRVDSDGAESTQHFAGVTAPRFRFVLVARYAPRID